MFRVYSISKNCWEIVTILKYMFWFHYLPIKRFTLGEKIKGSPRPFCFIENKRRIRKNTQNWEHQFCRISISISLNILFINPNLHVLFLICCCASRYLRFQKVDEDCQEPSMSDWDHRRNNSMKSTNESSRFHSKDLNNVKK